MSEWPDAVIEAAAQAMLDQARSETAWVEGDPETTLRQWMHVARAALSVIPTPLTDDEAVAVIVERMHDCSRPSWDYAAYLIGGYTLVPKETP